MRKFLLICLVLFTTTCYGQHSSSGVTGQADSLKMFYSLVVLSQETGVCDQCEETFLRLFPGTFKVFNDVYGWNNETNTMNVLYQYAYQHMKVLEGISAKDTAYYHKIIGITIGGTWDADAVDNLQTLVQDLFNDSPGIMLHLLSDRTDEEIKSFWFFFFDGPHPVKEIPEDVKAATEKFPGVYRQMKLAFDEVHLHTDH